MENKMNTTDAVLIVLGGSSAIVIGLILFYFLRSYPYIENKEAQKSGGQEVRENNVEKTVQHKLQFLFFFLALLLSGVVLFSGLAYFRVLSYV